VTEGVPPQATARTEAQAMRVRINETRTSEGMQKLRERARLRDHPRVDLTY